MANQFFLLLHLLLIPITAFSISFSDDPTSFIYAGCSQPKYSPDSPYQYAVESLLSSLANTASFSSFSNFTSPSPLLISALFQCHSDLPLPLCSSCIRSALTRLSSLCPSASSAALQLRSCYLRYGNDSFLARPDTSLLYKTCSTDLDAAGDFLADRDGALASLAGTGPSYRAGGAGGVRAEAQCVGDLSVRDCSDCVAAAAAQVKASCGGAANGEAYLGKCYVRYYFEDGAPPFVHGDHDDGTGKTLAIIIGLMAGVTLIIVFLSFINRSSGKY